MVCKQPVPLLKDDKSADVVGVVTYTLVANSSGHACSSRFIQSDQDAASGETVDSLWYPLLTRCRCSDMLAWRQEVYCQKATDRPLRIFGVVICVRPLCSQRPPGLPYEG